MDEEYMCSKFKEHKSWKEAIYDDAPVVLVWCDNYRQQKSLMNQLYHLACDGHCDRCSIIHHANTVKFNHINKKFIFAYEAVKFMGYGKYKSVYIDMRGKDAF